MNNVKHTLDAGGDSNLAEKVEPSGDPRRERGMFGLAEHCCPIVWAPASRMCTAHLYVRAKTMSVANPLIMWVLYLPW